MRRDFFRKPAAPAGRMGLKSCAWVLLLAGAATACGGPAPPSTIGRSAVSVAQESRAESGRSYTLGPQFAGQLQDMLGREAEALGGSREGVPLELNRQVLLNINRFLNEDRGFMTRSLSRGSKYIPLMKNIFRRKGLPEDLVYLALIESGFNNQAVSAASAAGPWQFIASTARRHGLVINDWVDERRDPVKSTYAAADYLRALHDAFGSWPMAIAAYNSGEGKIIRGVRNYGVSNFWDMSSSGDHLADETKLYVPSFLAAAIIAKDPTAYGLAIDAQPPDRWEEVSLPLPVTLAEAAQFAHTSLARLKELNPHLRKAVTPPNEAGFILRLPEGSSQAFISAYHKVGLGLAKTAETLPPVPRSGSTDLAHLRPELEAAASAAPLERPLPRPAPSLPVHHVVAAGDTLGGLARKYRTTVQELIRLNNLNSDRLRLGQNLTVKEGQAAGRAAYTAPPAAAKASPAPAGPGELYTVEAGDTLGGVAYRHGLTVNTLMEMNGLTNSNLRLGQKLKVKNPAPAAASAVPKPQPVPAAAKPIFAPAPASPSPPSAGPGEFYTVASGDTLGGVAFRHGLTVKALMEMNGLTNSNLRLGQKLKVKNPAPAPGTPGSDSIRVAEGDTLYSLARKHNLSVDQLKKLNDLSVDSLKSGQILKIK